MNSDRIEADGNNCFLHPNNRNQYHKWEETRGTNGSINLYTFCSIECQVLNFAPMGLLMIRTTDRLLILAKTFSEKLFETHLDRIECDGKNRFLPLYHFRNILSFTYMNTFSKKLTQDEFGSA